MAALLILQTGMFLCKQLLGKLFDRIRTDLQKDAARYRPTAKVAVSADEP